MANGYGRGGAARSGSAQRGAKEQYLFDPRQAQSYLSGNESDAYQTALSSLRAAPDVSASGRMKGDQKKRRFESETQAREKISRLNDIAAARAIVDYQRMGSQTAKGLQSVRPRGGYLIAPEQLESAVAGHKEFGGTARTGGLDPDSAKQALKGTYGTGGRTVEFGAQMRGILKLVNGN